MNETSATQVPLFTHDCDECTFLGISGEKDLYHCMQGGELFPTLIVRHGNEGPEYMSGLIFVELGLPEFVEAAKHAERRGLPITR